MRPDLSSRAGVLAYRDDLAERLDRAILDAGDLGLDLVYDSLVELRGKVIADLTNRALGLADVLLLPLDRPRPALVIAYDRYDDAAREGEIIARNQVAYPLFVPGPVEVMSR